MSAHRTRRRLAVGLAALLCALVTGCTGGFPFEFACPAIGYVSTVRVELVGNAEDVAEVRLCDGDGDGDGNCSAPAAEPRMEDAPLVVIEPDDLDELVTEPSPVPTREEVPYFATKNDENSWSMDVLSGLPSDVVVTAYRADGSVAGETSSTLEWVRVGGSEQCGGPMETSPVEIILG